jgi:site-specific recombinase XerC
LDDEAARNRKRKFHWSPNQLRHFVGTKVRKEYGIEAASVLLGHADVGVTQVYSEADRKLAIDVSRRIG